VGSHPRQDWNVGIKPILKILKELWLVGFHRPNEVAARLANLDRHLALRVQSILHDHCVA
jgi:hypothetical protein